MHFFNTELTFREKHYVNKNFFEKVYILRMVFISAVHREILLQFKNYYLLTSELK